MMVIGNKLVLVIKHLISRFFFKTLYVVEIRVDELHFIS